MSELPDTSVSSTALVIAGLELYGHRPLAGETDPRPAPCEERIAGAAADIFDALVATFRDSASEPDLDGLLWAQVQIFHRALDRLELLLDSNEVAQRKSQTEQDGSELRSVELEELLAAGATLIERRNALETLRDVACEIYARETGVPWRPKTGSLVQRRTLTASLIDSRDFIAAKRQAALSPLLPAGPRIAFTGGLECNDHRAIWDSLDRAHARHSNMVLLHGGSPRGAECIAAAWARARHVTQIVFKPDWTRHAKAAPFKRNDQLLDAMPLGLIAYPGSGVSANLIDKARKLGIPIWRCGGA